LARRKLSGGSTCFSEQEIQRFRRFNQRPSDIVDVITEVLVPAVDRDDERMLAALTRLEAAVTPPAPEMPMR
jgi:hypothetical protein